MADAAGAQRGRPAGTVHVSWPLATIGAIAILAHAASPTAPLSAQSAPATGLSQAAQPVSGFIAPDGRTFDQLVAMHVLPDPKQTPGVLNPAVLPDTIASTICVHGWTAQVRPPTSYTSALKDDETPPGHTPSEYELDHLISIEDGGDPNDAANLWMQAYNDLYGARIKDVLETKVSRMVCSGALTLDQARAALVPNWLVGFEKYVGPLPTGD